MRATIGYAFAILLLALSPLASAHPGAPLYQEAQKGAPAATSDAEGKVLLDKVVQGLGGETKVRSVKSVRAVTRSHFKAPRGEMTFHSETVVVLPDTFWQKMVSAEEEATTVVSPKAAFRSEQGQAVPFEGPELQELIQEMARDPIFVAQHAGDPAFVFHAAGSARIGKIEARVLEVSNPRAAVRWFIDPQSGRILRATWTRPAGEDEEDRGPAGETIEEYSDWRLVDGIWFPFQEVDTQPDGVVESVNFEQVVVNPKIDPRIFLPPGAEEWPAASNPEGKALLARVVEALGGEDKVRSVRSIRERGAAQRAGSGEQYQLETLMVFPDQVWQRLRVKGMPEAANQGEATFVVTRDRATMTMAGQTVSLPWERDAVLAEIGWDPARDPIWVAQHAGDPDFVFYGAGPAKVGELDTRILEVGSPAADLRWFVDPQTGHVVRATWKLWRGRRWGESVSQDYADWRLAGGLWFPFKETTHQGDQEVRSTEYTEIEVNPQVDPTLFQEPTFPVVERAELKTLDQARSIHIEDSWGGLGTPHSAVYDLQRDGNQFQGDATFAAGQVKKDDHVSIPLPVAQAFLRKLGESVLQEREYQPRIRHTDDYPSLSIRIEVQGGTVVFFSESQGRNHVPWGVTVQGKTYTIDSAVPAEALALLAPYLKADVLEQLMKQGARSR